MEDEREEGEIVDLYDDIYETIISSDEVDEDDLRQRIEELEAKNSELEKIASISKTYDYGLGPSNFINLVDDDDDDESYYRQPSKYEYSSYTSSRKSSRSKRRKACKHESKKSKRYKPYKTEKRKKTQPNRTRVSSDSSSDDEFELDRNKLQAALKRNNSSVHSSTLKRKLIGVSKTVEDFIKAKEDVEDEDISTSIEIMHLLNKINIDGITPNSKASIEEEETESCLNEQELRIIALKSAILKKAEARKKRKMIETQPYSPTDDVDVDNVIASKVSVIAKPKDDLDNMEISPAVSPTNHDGSLQLIDMELESDDESQKDPIVNSQHEVVPFLPLSEPVDITNVVSNDLILPVPDEMSLGSANVPEEFDQINVSSDCSYVRKQQEEEEEQALRASLLANLKASKKKVPSNVPSNEPVQKPFENSIPLEKTISDASMEMERLRKQVLSSMQKRKNNHRHLLPNPFAQKFFAQTPKPMEISMPQITSNLKEALKRIKERDKHNVEADAVSNANGVEIDINKVNRNVNVVAAVPKEIQIDLTESKKVQPESTERENVAVNLNGVIVPPKTITKEPIIISKKPSEPSNKVNDVLKNVTCNNSPVETKTKDASVPLVMSNKIENVPLEKSDAIKKAVAQRKVNIEPSLNQKENLQLRKVGVPAKRTAEDKPPTAKKTKITNSKVSTIITTPVEKPVKKMIIQLNNSDTESDDLELPNSETSLNNKSYSGVASPASYTFSPSSPITVADNKSSDVIPSTNDSFQRKLDEYLKSARTKVEQSKEETKPIKRSPSSVSYLPPSSQLEYRKLINRWALLEKQKLLKLNDSKIAATKPKPCAMISVTIANDLCQLKSNEQIVPLKVNESTSWKDNKDEILVTIQNVNSIDENKVSSPTVVTVVTNSGIEINTLKVPEISATTPVQSEEPTMSKQPDKTNHYLQSWSTLSEQDKNKLLQKSVSEYLSHSKLYLVDLNNMSLLVNKARQEKEKQFQIESEIEELERKVHQLKKQLVEQKMSVSKLYPIISSSHKNIMKKRSKSLQLNKRCYFFGNELVGPEYKISDDPKTDIAEKVKSLSSETKLLRNMKKPVSCDGKACSEPISTEKKILQTETVDHTAVAAVPITSEKSADTERSSINCTPDNIPMPYSMIKYKSPLDHMQNIGITNPDLIVCPFQLLGQCEDKECTYQHLS